MALLVSLCVFCICVPARKLDPTQFPLAQTALFIGRIRQLLVM